MKAGVGWGQLDLRSLALMRVACACICLFDLGDRALAFRDMYTREGLLPLRSYLWQPDLSWRIWSLYYVGDSPLLVGAMFVLTALLALAVLLGFHTRISSAGLWVMVLSLHHRNILVINGGDHYLRMLLFWGAFLPWGARLSLDEAVGCAPDRRLRTPAGAAYMAQLLVVYWFNALYKTSPYWTTDGSAIYRALRLSDIGNAAARQMTGWGSILVPMSLSVRYLELAAPLLLLLPYLGPRLAGLLALASLHLGILATMRVELFSVVALAGLLGMLPTALWSSPAGGRFEASLTSLFQRLARRLSLSLRPRPDERTALRRMRDLLVTGLACFVVFQSACDYLTNDRWREQLGVGRVLGLYVKWSMFAPGPPADGWSSFPAVRRSGQVVDLLTGLPPVAFKLATTDRYRRAGRWKSYRSAVTSGGFGSNAQAYLDLMVRRWNQRMPGDPIVSARYIYYRESEVKGYRLPRVRSSVEAVYP
jgi:hypothetical protein